MRLGESVDDAARKSNQFADRLAVARKALRLIRQEQLFPQGSCALVMVSGGQDSVALLHFLATGGAGKQGPARLHVIHVNHHLRGEESNADQLLVEELCASLGVSVTVEHCPVDKKQGNVQEAARVARRQAALEVAAKVGCERIALGHTADDVVETMLYRLGRYGGLAAFAPMAALDPPWVRPLLTCRRFETAAYCAANKLTYADDRGNIYPGYARTGIRERVLPAWESALPGAVEAASRAAQVASEFRALADWVVGDVLGVVSGDTGLVVSAGVGSGEDGTAHSSVSDRLKEITVLNAVCLGGLPAPVRRLFLHAWLVAHGRSLGSRATVLAVESVLSAGGSKEVSLTGGWRVCKEYEWLRLERKSRAGRQTERATSPAPVDLLVPGVARWGEVEIQAEYVDAFYAPDVSCETYVDASCLASLLTVRGALPGDKLRPLGSPGLRKLQDVFVDLKVPRHLRPFVPLVVSEERIVWVAGLVSAEEGRITPDTKKIVRLRMTKSSHTAEETEKPARQGCQ